MTRWERLYRSDVLTDLTPSDLVLFRSLGIVTVIDLRSPVEVQRLGLGLALHESARVVNVSVLSDASLEVRGEAADVDRDYLVRRYLHYLDVGGDAFVNAISEMTTAESYPMVFNCFFGKDRTGVLAAVVLSCVGVEHDAIIEDYALTASRVPSILEKLSEDPLYRSTIERTHPILLSADERTMARFLHEMDERFGGPRSWAMNAGVTRKQLNALSDLVLG